MIFKHRGKTGVSIFSWKVERISWPSLYVASRIWKIEKKARSARGRSGDALQRGETDEELCLPSSFSFPLFSFLLSTVASADVSRISNAIAANTDTRNLVARGFTSGLGLELEERWPNSRSNSFHRRKNSVCFQKDLATLSQTLSNTVLQNYYLKLPKLLLKCWKRE